MARGAELEGPIFRPLDADLSSLPPTLIHAGDAEMQRDDSVTLAERMKEQGVEVEMKVWPAMIHAFHLFAGILPLAQQAIEEMAAFLGERL